MESEELNCELSAGSDARQCLSTTDQTLKNSSESSISDAELRKRARRERNMKTAEKIEEMKRKQQECEIRQKRKSVLIPLSIGLFIILGGSILVYKFYYRN